MARYLTVLLTALLCGCGGNQPLAPAGDESLIIFVLPGMISQGGAYQPSYGVAPSVSLHDVTNPERKIVGILGVGKKLAYRVRPGKHQFMLVNLVSTDFMEANVVAGKTYYVVVQLQALSGFVQRYAFKPVRPVNFDDGSFQRWQNGTSFVDRSDAWEGWEKANRQSVDERLRKHWPAWASQGADERALRTLHASDGR